MTIHIRPSGDHLVGTFLPHESQPYLPPYRVALEAEIERMIEMLDALDGDPDLEPSLGGETKFRLDAAGELRAEVDLEGDDVDREPSLGSFDGMLNQERWCRTKGWHGIGEDRELDECDREDGGDYEPSLGSLGGTAASFTLGLRDVSPTWAGGDDQDREPDGDELDGDSASSDEPMFPKPRRDMEVEHNAIAAEARRLGSIITRLQREGVRA